MDQLLKFDTYAEHPHLNPLMPRIIYWTSRRTLFPCRLSRPTELGVAGVQEPNVSGKDISRL